MQIVLLLIECWEYKQIEKCSEIFDDAILLGCTQDVYTHEENFKQLLMEIFAQELGKFLYI